MLPGLLTTAGENISLEEPVGRIKAVHYSIFTPEGAENSHADFKAPE
jgi:hypothetical protein